MPIGQSFPGVLFILAIDDFRQLIRANFQAKIENRDPGSCLTTSLKIPLNVANRIIIPLVTEAPLGSKRLHIHTHISWTAGDSGKVRTLLPISTRWAFSRISSGNDHNDEHPGTC
jgi:hypothetical protein